MKKRNPTRSKMLEDYREIFSNFEFPSAVLSLVLTVFLACFLPAHVMDSILISEPVRSLDCVVHVPTPVIL